MNTVSVVVTAAGGRFVPAALWAMAAACAVGGFGLVMSLVVELASRHADGRPWRARPPSSRPPR